MSTTADGSTRWYHGVTPYMWLVLAVASLGWVFDIFEGQIFVASMKEAMPSLLPLGTMEGAVDFYNNVAMGAYLVGGAVGGVLFGMLSDRVGRTRTMILTILMYSMFTFVTALAQNWLQMTVLRFLVAMGTGGEWAVASAMVAEVFPRRARAWSLGIFHASSVFGTYLAVIAGVFVVGNPSFGWRWGFVIGAVPAVLTLLIRWSLREPEQWRQACARARVDPGQQPGRLLDLFSASLRRHTVIGLILATVGLATFWGVHIYGRELLRSIVERPHLQAALNEFDARMGTVERRIAGLGAGRVGGDLAVADVLAILRDEYPAAADAMAGRLRDARETWSHDDVAGLRTTARKRIVAATLRALPAEDKRSNKNWEMLGMFLVTSGGGLGLLSFGPLCERFGRRATFLFFHIGGLVTALVVFQLMATVSAAALCWMLPLFGYMTLGMHAGYAIYFPELFPTRLRGTGGGFCFNGGRFLAASILILRGWLRAENGLGLTLETTATLLSLLFLVGMVTLLFAPETKGQELPD